ncbi:sterol desaturase family protein [Flectobacillus roseus]|uniref:Sterol desaturase family protein n=1 Tax=Flectobacillus roseus TaxID=502259 RepID=A0ABT6Y8D5_9BACT|nr:sterol desaturase family protein [Flectobacillus roseus]MDI9859791.1 sterol desaturase family protein [Flectobacillus roseus]
MERYGQILNFAMPIFLLLVLLEKTYGWLKYKDTFKPMDMLSSLSSGYTNIIKDVLGISISIITYDWMVNHWAIYHLESTWAIYVTAFIALDFTGYWGHRLSHQINFLWNQHLIHHSSEEFNLACALRQSISTFINFFTIFLLPAALLGVPSIVIATVAPIHLFAQFWYHTTYINRMGWLEHILVTPSHHRVHHSINPEYIDKNHSQIFIIWDKMFGTFQEELPSVPCVYGITVPVRTWNPIKINFHHIWILIQDAWHTKSWVDKARIWFMPTGWRPEDVKDKFPLAKIEDVYHFQKYTPETSSKLATWSFIQFFFTFALIVYFFGHLAQIGSPLIFVYGGFIFLSVYAYTEMMDLNPHSFWYELFKNIIGLGLIAYLGDWFGMNQYWVGVGYFVGIYFVLSTIITAYLVYSEKKVFQQKIYTN